MKNKVIYIFLFFTILSFIFFMSILFKKNIYLYKSFSGNFSNNYLGVFVSEKEIDYFYRNRFIFIDGDKYKYKVISIDKDVLFRDEAYSYILLSIDGNFSEGEIVVFSILEKKIINYKIFNSIWR